MVTYFGLTSQSVSPCIGCHRVDPKRPSRILSTHTVANISYILYCKFVSSLLHSEGNYTQVRVAAFDALFLTKWFTPKIMRYILAVAAGDSSRTVRRHVARNACQSLALLVSLGELKNSAKESESLLIEEDGSAQDKTKETKKSEVDSLVRTLRKDKEVGKNEMIREFLVPIAL